ncbi:MAG: DNA-3-methyladenine glycosylase I, partial [Minwuiales bacterium]|nr:DNA-3-methyladenine glycosylase I [Minwuiales bacterium]
KPVAYMSDESLEAQLKNAAIVRNWQKIKSIRDNAQFVVELAEEHGSAAKFFADWPGTDQIGLMEVLKKRASRLSGTTGQYFLRFLGKDSFVLSKSVVAALIEDGVVDKAPTSKSALATVQEAFNAWQTESGRPLTQISRVLALSVDA